MHFRYSSSRMAAPPKHDRTVKPKEDDDVEDPVETMINKTGCLQLHYAVQECMGEKQDWRLCQKEVTEFRKCMEQGMKKKLKG
ncbi:coiled-coil-helix-coiled-coil-helix domain-containing protein 8 [Plakobranchus ocellatus]|uniref:Coiled-coil-helix-coiled-coil-helix domain-containing protein 8 n=1 Tax=Plakobranchus ocellatus TaxID=259542 RepID=A0AAV3ZWB7_9GAST|nr:coiled-coil-helix-coiled-coil-helix domain-containing protein 8 [Plakobranchus ocellatus]